MGLALTDLGSKPTASTSTRAATLSAYGARSA